MFSFSINTAKQGNTISSFNNFFPSIVATDSTHSGGRIWSIDNC